ncbi:hypothetical protein G352_07123 [Rhodococcus ruber BKS 20-38]|uniref:Uncharacterized protein n=1 Tax=Rhodococcus ruber BKS 20-38 TaxID=1278076 RepID=M2ZZ52_9NOCA|nr:hypothetical protein G352_07123 [Rhodococcus ruber BKS 20-38]
MTSGSSTGLRLVLRCPVMRRASLARTRRDAEVDAEVGVGPEFWDRSRFWVMPTPPVADAHRAYRRAFLVVRNHRHLRQL